MTVTENIQTDDVKPAAKPLTVEEMCLEMPHVFRVGGVQMGEKRQSYDEIRAAVEQAFQ